MDKIKKRHILNDCNNPNISIDKLDQFVTNGDISIEEFKQYNLEISKVKELERRQRVHEGIEPEIAPVTETVGSTTPPTDIFDTGNSLIFGDSSESSFFTINDSLFGNTQPQAPIVATPPPTNGIQNKAVEIQKVLNEEVAIQHIIDCLSKGVYTYADLEAAGLPNRMINAFKYYQKQFPTRYYNVDDLPPMDKGRTDVFFVGIPASGKSVMLSGLLYYTKKKGVSIPDAYNQEGEKYAAQITADLEKGVLPKATGSGTYNYIAISLKDERRKAHPLNIVEVPGENYAKIFDKGLDNDEVRGFVNYVKNSNRKILIFVLDALEHQNRLDADYANAYGQGDIYVSILNMFKTYKILDKTDAVYIVVNKFDIVKKEHAGTAKTDLELAGEFVNEEFKNLLNNCIDAKENSNNKFKIKVFPFSIGEVCYDKILKNYHDEYSKNIVEQILSDSFIVGGGKGIFSSLFR